MMEHNTTVVTATVLTQAQKPAYKNPGDVEFDVKYSEDYKGPRWMKEGRTVISKESAEKFTQMGIGKVATKEAEAKDVAEATDAAEAPAEAAESKPKKGRK